MAAIEDWSDCLPPGVRAVWPRLAHAVEGTGGALFGGTALTIHLRHRQSFDLDYLIPGPVNTEEIAERLRKGGPIQIMRDEEGLGLHATVGGILVEIFQVPERGYNPGEVQTLDEPKVVDGVSVASLADLLASKLDILLYRSKLRDYIDLVAIDELSSYSLEDGLLFHMRRCGATPNSFELARIINLLEEPADLASDDVFEKQRAAALGHLRTRTVALRQFLYHEILDNNEPPNVQVRDRPDNAGPTDASRPKPTLPRSL
jgi:hypothetical protein